MADSGMKGYALLRDEGDNPWGILICHQVVGAHPAFRIEAGKNPQGALKVGGGMMDDQEPDRLLTLA
jgi:hypothetical protein